MADPNPQSTPAPTPASTTPVATPAPADTTTNPSVGSAPPVADVTSTPTVNPATVQAQLAPGAAEQAKLAEQIKTSAQTTPPPEKHARLLAMVQGLAAGLGAAGTSLSTHGKEGGAAQASEILGQEQQQKIAKQQAWQAQQNAKTQQLITVYDTNAKQMQSIMNLAMIPNQMTEADLRVKGLQQDIAAKAQDALIQLADFKKQNWGLTPRQAAGTDPTGPADLSTSKSMLGRTIPAATAILGADNPAVVAAQKLIDNPTPSVGDIMAAGQGLTTALQLNDEVVKAKTAQQAEAKTAPLGAKADALNAAMLQRYQVLNPGAKALPGGYVLSKDSTPDDFDRVDKIMQQTENAQSTQATRALSNQIRQQTLDLLKGPSGVDPNATGPEYLKQVQAADPGEANMLKGYGSGVLEFPATATRTVQGQALLTKILRAYPDFDPSAAPAYYKTRNDFTSGKTSVGINSYNTAINHLGRMYDHVAGASNADLNNPTSDVNRQLQTDKTAVSTELAKAVANGSLTEGEKDSWEAAISGKTFGVATKDKYNTQIKEVVGLMNGKLDSYQQQWKNGKKAASGQWETTPMPRGAEPPTITSDAAQAVISKIGSGAAPSGGTSNQPDPFAAFGGKAR